MMSSVAVLSVLALGLLASGSTEAKDCSSQGETYKPGQSIVGPGCTTKLTCQSSGQFYGWGDSTYKCPANSECYRGMECRCKFGFKETKDNGFLTKCTAAASCKVSKTLSYQHNKQWLSKDCKTRYRCESGKTQTFTHSCPRFAECSNGQCRCETTSIRYENDFGLVTSCPLPLCKYGGKTYKMGDYFLNNGCTERRGCFSVGVREHVQYQCPFNTQCVDRECVCKDGLIPSGKDSKGLITGCKPATCKFNNVERKDGEVWLNDQCNTVFKCEKGVMNIDSYSCPRYAYCRNSLCQCNRRLSVAALDQYGWVAACS